MAEQESQRNRFREAQSAFDQLDVEDKAIFLVEATLSTVARGIEEVGRVLADELDTLFHQRPPAEPASSEPDAAGDTPGPSTEAHSAEAAEDRETDVQEREEPASEQDDDEEPATN